MNGPVVKIVSGDDSLLDAMTLWFEDAELCRVNLMPVFEDTVSRRKALAVAFFSPAISMLGIEVDGKLAGFCALAEIEDYVQVPITVAEAWARGKGVAVEALQQVFLLARKLRIPLLTQRIPPDNEKMIRVSKRAGFVENVAKRNGYVVLEKEV